MSQINETPPVKGGARSDLLPGASQSPFNLSHIQAQHLTRRLNISAKHAAIIAPLAFPEAAI